MIIRINAFTTSDGKTVATLEEAQTIELISLLSEAGNRDNHDNTYDSYAKFLVKNREKVIDILTTTPRSKTRARAINGGKKSRATRAIAIQTEVSNG